MAVGSTPDAWLRGPVPGVPDELQPVAHALQQAREDIARVASAVPRQALWHQPGGAASAGYHLRHMTGSLDRLCTYARGAPLSDAQRDALARERDTGPDAAALVHDAQACIDRALEQLKATPPGSLGDHRAVGRARLPSTVRGLLFHAAEHTARHVGQLITTLRMTGPHQG